MKKLYTGIMLTALGILVTAQTENSGYGFYEAPYVGENVPYNGVTDGSGNTYITGFSSDENSPQGNIFTIKINNAGEIVWKAREAGTDFTTEAGKAITLDEDGNPIVSGFYWNGNNMDIKTVKYEKNNGSVVWSSIFDGAQNALDYPAAVSTDSDGNIVVAGYSYYGNNSIGYSVVKYNSQGVQLWSTIEENETEGTSAKPSSISIDQNGNIGITGMDVDPSGFNRYLTVLYSPEGELLWKRTYLHIAGGSPSDSDAREIRFDIDGNVYVTGTFAVGDFYNNKIGTIKYSASGDLLWENTFYENNNTLNGFQMEIAGEKLYVAGTYYDLNIYTEGSILISYSLSGEQEWIQKTSDMVVGGVELITDSALQPVLATWAFTPDWMNNFIQLNVYDTNGNQVSEKSFQRSNDGIGYMGFSGIGINSEDDIYVYSNNRYAQLGNLYEVIKFPETADEIEWMTHYKNNGAGNSRMKESKSDYAGNTIVVGYNGEITADGQFLCNYFVMKQNEEAEILWQKEIISSPAPIPVYVEVNSNNEIIILYSKTYESLFSLSKFSDTGELIWEIEKEIQNPEMNKLLTDVENNIYVVGTTFNDDVPESKQRFSALKFSDSGSELWENHTQSDNEDYKLYVLSETKFDHSGNLISVGAVDTYFENNAAVLSISATGELNWLTLITEEESNSYGIDIDIDQDNDIYILSEIKYDSDFKLKSLVSKLTSDGSIIFMQTHGQPESNITPYRINVVDGGFNIVFSDLYDNQPNKMSALKYDTDGNEIHLISTEINRYYRDCYFDDFGNIYMLNQIFIGNIPQRETYSQFITGSIFKINAEDNEVTETIYQGPEYSLYEPLKLIPHPDGRLEVGGQLLHESFTFTGLYFFGSEYDTMDTHDSLAELKNWNWLGQNFPNPGKLVTTIPFKIKNGGIVNIELFNSQGSYVRQLTDRYFEAGQHNVNVDLTGIPKGIYFYRLSADSFVASKKLIVQ